MFPNRHDFESQPHELSAEITRVSSGIVSTSLERALLNEPSHSNSSSGALICWCLSIRICGIYHPAKCQPMPNSLALRNRESFVTPMESASPSSSVDIECVFLSTGYIRWISLDDQTISRFRWHLRRCRAYSMPDARLD